MKKGYYEKPINIRQDEDNFYFAIAVTAKQNFESHTTEAFEKSGGSINLRYVISGGEEDGKVFNIGMAPCSDLTFYKPSGIPHTDRIAAAHMEIPQFFCPSAFDLSFFGSSDDIAKKVLFVDVKSRSDEYLEGKHIAMLINTRDISFEEDYEQVKLSSHTDLMWMPVNSRTPMSNVVTFTNHQFFKKETEYDQYQYDIEDVENIEWISVDKEIESTPYSFPVSNPTVKAQILFQTSYDLEVTVHKTDRMFFINIVALGGGALFALIFVVGIFFKLWVSWLMHLTIVRNLFKIDPAQNKKPKSAQAMKRKNPKLLLAEAKKVAKKRVAMTRNCCDRTTLIFEAVIGVIFCKATKFARILAEGKREVQ